MKPYKLATCLFWFSPLTLATQYYPSAGTAVVLPGYHQAGVDLEGNPVSAEEIKAWELEHADISFGAYSDPADNAKIDAISYMYNQALSANTTSLEDFIRNYAVAAGFNYEDFFLHFAEDTVLAEVDPSHGEFSVYNRKPIIVGYTADSDHAGFLLYEAPPWNVDVFEHVSNGGGLFVYHSEKIDQLEFSLSQFGQEGQITIEYPTAVDTNNRATAWKPVTILLDGTENLSQNGTVTWQIPTDWVRATTHDGSGLSYGGGQYFGSTFLRDGGKLYAVKISWSGSETATRPHLQQVQLKEWIGVVETPLDAPTQTSEGLTIQRWRSIKGFDKSADANQDGYLNDQEFANRSNLNATARYRWESRVVPVGRMWNQTSSHTITNLQDPGFITSMAHYYSTTWPQQGVKGAYNDDTTKLIGPYQFKVYSGGCVDELGLVVDSEAANTLYQKQFAAMLESFQTAIPGSLIGANIGPANLFGRGGQAYMANAANVYLREHYFYPSIGLSGYSGIAKFWDNQALFHQGRKVIFQASSKYGRSTWHGNTEENWLNDQYSLVAVYYLLQQPGVSYLNIWNSSYHYGSGNTATVNYHSADIPKNIAYLPDSLLKIDLGEPLTELAADKEPLAYMLATESPVSADYTVVADSTARTISNMEIPGGSVEVTPTYIYYLFKSSTEVVPGAPLEAVLARDYSNGMVLFRTDFAGVNSDYFNTEKLVLQLPKPMRPVSSSGEILPAVSEITLGGYEGLILLNN